MTTADPEIIITEEFLKEHDGEYGFLYSEMASCTTTAVATLDYKPVCPEEIAKIIEKNGYFAFMMKLYEERPETEGKELWKAQLYICPKGSYSVNHPSETPYFMLGFNSFGEFEVESPVDYSEELDGWFADEKGEVIRHTDIEVALANHAGFNFGYDYYLKAYNYFLLELYRSTYAED